MRKSEIRRNLRTTIRPAELAGLFSDVRKQLIGLGVPSDRADAGGRRACDVYMKLRRKRVEVLRRNQNASGFPQNIIDSIAAAELGAA